MILCNARTSAGVRLSAKKAIYTPVSYHIRIINTVYHPAKKTAKGTLINNLWKNGGNMVLNDICTESACSETYFSYIWIYCKYIKSKACSHQG